MHKFFENRRGHRGTWVPLEYKKKVKRCEYEEKKKLRSGERIK
jgi:hypothetical protein